MEVHGVNHKAIEILLEDGININDQTSDHVDQYFNIGITHLITVCGHAKERCPLFHKKTIKEHHIFLDPSKINGTDIEIKEAFRTTRDKIKTFCKDYLIRNFTK